VAAVRIGTAAAIGTTARLVRELRCARSSRPSEAAEETPTTEPEGQVNDFRHQDTAEDGNTWSVVEVLAEEPDWPAVGDGHDDQGDEELQPVARSTNRCGERDAKHVCVPLRRVRAGELRVRTFSTNSRPALRAAACGGRPRPAVPMDWAGEARRALSAFTGSIAAGPLAATCAVLAR
jgi:hypothetical protein